MVAALPNPPSAVSSSRFISFLEKYRDQGVEVLVYLNGQQEPFVGTVLGDIDRVLTLEGQPAEIDTDPRVLVHLAVEAIIGLEVHLEPEPVDLDDPDDLADEDPNNPPTDPEVSDSEVVDYLAGKANPRVEKTVNKLVGSSE